MQKRLAIVVLALVASASLAYADASFPAPVVSQHGAAIASAFGPRANEQFHAGTDIAAAVGAEVHAPAQGRVLQVDAPGTRAGYHGQVVEIDHGALGRTRFSNLEGVTLQSGATVNAGDVIGRITANDHPHVHVELWRGETMIDPATVLTLTATH